MLLIPGKPPRTLRAIGGKVERGRSILFASSLWLRHRVAFGAKAELGRAAEPAASVENDPKPTFAPQNT